MTADCRPWVECVELHPDVLADDFSESIFALDLGPLSDYLVEKELGLKDSAPRTIPTVYRDAASFFAASYLTDGLKSLLRDVLGQLAGKRGNQVLKLQTPFGGGKSHTLAALLHAARSRHALDALPEAAGLPRPEHIRVAVVDGQYFDPTNGKRFPGGESSAKTLWGWIAWALGGPEGYGLVRAQDEARVAPGGDVLIELLKGRPSLILIDELLQYLISVGGIQVEQTNLRDETSLFLQRLTVAVGNVENAVLVYSLQSSARESLEHTGLLQKIEHLAARKDSHREPVAGTEILNVIQCRLLAGKPDPRAVEETANAYCQRFTQMRRGYANGRGERQQAEEDGLKLRERIKASYPFHPALTDLMRERWAAIPEFQRTRGALRFLASCLRSAYRAGKSRALLGPGDVPIQDNDVRLTLLKEVGQREDFQACLEHDFAGANARARRIDERRTRETTMEAGKQPATRLATTILLHSFGGLRRTQSGQEDSLPAGIGEAELLSACVGPDLDTTTIQACLKELREQCLYLHFDGTRYCFKKDPNVTLLVEQEAEIVARDSDGILKRIRRMLEERLTGQKAIIWPTTPSDIPDLEPRFLLAYLPPDFVAQESSIQRQTALTLFEQYGTRQREFRNGLGLAVPSTQQVNALNRSVRYLISVERIQAKWREHNLTDAQKKQIQERLSTEKTTTESALLKLYDTVWLPASNNGKLKIDSVSIGSRPLQTTLGANKHALIHQRLMELLVTVKNRVFATLAPGKIAELFRLGEPGNYAAGIATNEILKGFYGFLGFPRLLSDEAVRRAIIRGIETGLFGYTTGRPQLDENGRYLVDRNRIAFNRAVAEDEIDLDAGFLIVPAAMPESQATTEDRAASELGINGTPGQPANVGESGDHSTDHGQNSAYHVDKHEIAVTFVADREKLYAAWNALGNLVDLADTITIKASATIPKGYDKTKLENGVLEPLRELGLIDDD